MDMLIGNSDIRILASSFLFYSGIGIASVIIPRVSTLSRDLKWGRIRKKTLVSILLPNPRMLNLSNRLIPSPNYKYRLYHL